MESNSYINKYRYFHNINYSFCHKNMLTLTQGEKKMAKTQIYSAFYIVGVYLFYKLLDIIFFFFLIFTQHIIPSPTIIFIFC